MINVNASGRRWARFTLALALIVSVVGNVTHTVLADSTISLWLRVPAAIVWPAFTFLGIEVLVRIIWERSLTHRLVRNMVLLPAIPAAVGSYEHLYSLLLQMAERHFIAFIGPLAIDGAMIGMTMVLLFTRSTQLVEAPVNVDAEMERLERLLAEQTFADEVQRAYEMSVETVEPEPAPAPLAIERKARAPRSAWNAREVAEMAVDGHKASDINAKLNVPLPTAYRFTKVARTLKADPRAEIFAADKVHPEHVAIMRELVSR